MAVLFESSLQVVKVDEGNLHRVSTATGKTIYTYITCRLGSSLAFADGCLIREISTST